MQHLLILGTYWKLSLRQKRARHIARPLSREGQLKWEIGFKTPSFLTVCLVE